MKKALLTRQFINENIKINTTVSSYPLRSVTSKAKTSEDIPPTDKAKKTKEAGI